MIHLLLSILMGVGALVCTRITLAYRAEGAHRSDDAALRMEALQVLLAAVVMWFACAVFLMVVVAKLFS